MINWIIVDLLTLAFCLAIYKIGKDRKRHKCHCGNNCGACQGAYPKECQGSGPEAKDKQ